MLDTILFPSLIAFCNNAFYDPLPIPTLSQHIACDSL